MGYKQIYMPKSCVGIIREDQEASINHRVSFKLACRTRCRIQVETPQQLTTGCYTQPFSHWANFYLESLRECLNFETLEGHYWSLFEEGHRLAFFLPYTSDKLDYTDWLADIRKKVWRLPFDDVSILENEGVSCGPQGAYVCRSRPLVDYLQKDILVNLLVILNQVFPIDEETLFLTQSEFNVDRLVDELRFIPSPFLRAILFGIPLELMSIFLSSEMKK